MLRPASEINFPPSKDDCLRAKMIARMETLSQSSNALMAVISERVNAEMLDNKQEVEELTAEQDRILENMRNLVKDSA